MSNVPNANLTNAIMIECRGYENMECEKADFNDAIINDTKLIENTPKKKRKSRLKDDNRSHFKVEKKLLLQNENIMLLYLGAAQYHLPPYVVCISPSKQDE